MAGRAACNQLKTNLRLTQGLARLGWQGKARLGRARRVLVRTGRHGKAGCG
nr:MAG TPA: hypothetical protein [Caudoviricetes sp.]